MICVRALLSLVFFLRGPQKRGETLDELLNNADLMNMVLQAHIVPDMELFTDDFVDGSSLPNLLGTEISIDEQGMWPLVLPSTSP